MRPLIAISESSHRELKMVPKSVHPIKSSWIIVDIALTQPQRSSVAYIMITAHLAVDSTASGFHP
ncbi:13237_t:CDS:2 [Acaulospora morrowiae]|uniref:13237_t:CDS:1 n=1 Tax=Acaulospora morrowiae TaxID=94023 RepID=A0A9N8V873_9GLOM|nr:13237_t:CDS:2 [Acaulospora morrowiae]